MTTNFVDTLRVDDEEEKRKKRSRKAPKIKGQRKLSTRKRVLQAWQLYLFLLLPLGFLILFNYVPMYGVQIAFRDFTPVGGITGSEFVGLKHFERFFESYQFRQLLGNTLILALYQLVVGFPVPIILALALNAVRQKFFAKSVQMITYAPNFISVVVVVGIMVMLLDPTTGVVNNFLQLIGLDPINFMGSIDWFRHLYVFSGVWQGAGFGAIIYLAALSGVSPELHEAAIVDGASRLRRMWSIDLPGILPIAVIMLVLDVGNIMKIGFEKVLLMQNTINLPVSEVIDTYVYKIGLDSPIPQYSYATAIGLFQSVIGIILLLIVNAVARRVTKAGLF